MIINWPLIWGLLKKKKKISVKTDVYETPIIKNEIEENGHGK